MQGSPTNVSSEQDTPLVTGQDNASIRSCRRMKVTLLRVQPTILSREAVFVPNLSYRLRGVHRVRRQEHQPASVVLYEVAKVNKLLQNSRIPNV